MLLQILLQQPYVSTLSSDICTTICDNVDNNFHFLFSHRSKTIKSEKWRKKIIIWIWKKKLWKSCSNLKLVTLLVTLDLPYQKVE